MKLLKKNLLTIVILFIGVAALSFLPKALAGTDSHSCNVCEETSGCGGHMILDEDNLPWPEGCTGSSGSACSGTCYRCKNSTSKFYCRYTGDSDDSCYYQTGDKVLKCGDKYSYSCSGNWDDHCSCPTTGGTDTENDCNIDKCSA